MEKELVEQTCVVVADRHPGILEGIRGLLETMFDSVVMVADEKSLLNTVDRLRPDLVLVDLSFPVSGGLGIGSVLRQRAPALKFILIGADDEPEVVDAGLASGAYGFVLKWCLARDLIKAVETVQQGRTFVSSGVGRSGGK